jgi:hypothetical protein
MKYLETKKKEVSMTCWWYIREWDQLFRINIIHCKLWEEVIHLQSLKGRQKRENGLLNMTPKETKLTYSTNQILKHQNNQNIKCIKKDIELQMLIPIVLRVISNVDQNIIEVKMSLMQLRWYFLQFHLWDYV